MGKLRRCDLLTSLIHNVLHAEILAELVDRVLEAEQHGLDLRNEALHRREPTSVQLPDPNGEVRQPSLGVEQELVCF